MKLKDLIFDIVSLQNSIFRRRDIYCILEDFFNNLKSFSAISNENKEIIENEFKRLEENINSIIAGEGDYKFIPSDGTVGFSSLNDELKKWIYDNSIESIKVEQPDDNINTTDFWNLLVKFTNSDRELRCNLSALIKEFGKGGGINIDDLDFSHEVDDTEFRIYVAAEDEEDDILLITIPLVNKTENEAGLMSPSDKKKLDNIAWDENKGLLTLGKKVFKLTPYEEERHITIQTYDAPVITSLSYKIAKANGETISPTFNITQIQHNTYNDGSTSNVTLVATNFAEAETLGINIRFTSANLSVNESTGDVIVPANNKLSIKTLGTINITAVNKNDKESHNSSKSFDVSQEAGTFTIGNKDAIQNVKWSGEDLILLPVTKSSGIKVIEVVSDNLVIATASYEELVNSIGIKININNNEESRSCNITVKTNDRTYNLPLSQQGKIVKKYAYYGMSDITTNIPENIETSGLLNAELTSNTTTVTTSSDVSLGQRFKCHFVAVPTGYTVTTCVDTDNDNWDITKKETDNYSIYYIGSDTSGFLSNTFKWTINKN